MPVFLTSQSTLFQEAFCSQELVVLCVEALEGLPDAQGEVINV
jgi:hypothetical protein